MTNATLILRDRNFLEGSVQAITIASTVNFNFSQTVSSLSVHNVTGDFVEVICTTNPVSGGNQRFIMSPASSQSIANSPEVTFVSITVNDLGLTGRGGGWIICNTFYN